MNSLHEISIEIHRFIKATYPDLDYILIMGNAEGSGMAGNGCPKCAQEYLNFVIKRENIQHLETDEPRQTEEEVALAPNLRLVKNES